MPDLKCKKCGGTGELCPAGPSDAPMETCDACDGKRSGRPYFDFNAVCCAAGGDWCLEHVADDRTNEEIYLAIIGDQRKQINELRAESFAAAKQREELAAALEQARDFLNVPTETTMFEGTIDEETIHGTVANQTPMGLVAILRSTDPAAILTARDRERDAALIDKLISRARGNVCIDGNLTLTVDELQDLRAKALEGELL